MPTIHRVSGLDSNEIEDIIASMGDQWISFKNGQRSHGFWVKIEERSIRYIVAFFSISLYETVELAKNAAVEFRDDFIRAHHLVPSEHAGNIPSRRYKKSENLSGRSGLRLSFTSSCKDKDILYGRWVAQTGKGPVSFGASKYGFNQAYKKALEARLNYLMQSDDIDQCQVFSKEEVEMHLKDKLGKNWKNKIFSYEKWWKNAEEEKENNTAVKSSPISVHKAVDNSKNVTYTPRLS